MNSPQPYQLLMALETMQNSWFLVSDTHLCLGHGFKGSNECH